jgi:gluconate kinase
MCVRWLLIVNGPPGSGKTTLAHTLAHELAVPLFSKDAVKETLLDMLGFADRNDSRRIGAASGEVLWTLVRDSPTPAIVESWLALSLREVVRAGVERASVDRVIEVWCSCQPDEARRRYSDRVRHPGHFDGEMLLDLDAVLASAEPLALGEVIRVATDRPVEIEPLLALIRAAVDA